LLALWNLPRNSTGEGEDRWGLPFKSLSIPRPSGSGSTSTHEPIDISLRSVSFYQGLAGEKIMGFKILAFLLEADLAIGIIVGEVLDGAGSVGGDG